LILFALFLDSVFFSFLCFRVTAFFGEINVAYILGQVKSSRHHKAPFSARRHRLLTHLLSFISVAWRLHSVAVYIVFQCCSKYDCEYEDFLSLSKQHIQGYYRSVVSNEDVVRVRMLLELLFIRSGMYQLDNFSASDVKMPIDSHAPP